MVARFFLKSDTAILDSGKRINEEDSDPESDTFSLLSGPSSSGKTLLLFQYALNLVEADPEGHVVFLCNRRRLEAKPPSVSHSYSSLFDRIHFKYVDDEDNIKKYFAAFHLLHPFPLAVIIDDFGDSFHEKKCQERYNNARGRDLAIVRVLALCQSAIIHARKTAPCKLLLSDTHHGEAPRLTFLYKRWVSSIFTIEPQGACDDKHGSFPPKTSTYVIRKATNNGNGNQGTTTAKYSIVPPQYLIFEGINNSSR